MLKQNLALAGALLLAQLSASASSSSAPAPAPSTTPAATAKEDLSSWKFPAPPQLPADVKLLPVDAPGGVRFGVQPPDTCPQGFTRLAGICWIDPLQLPTLAKLSFPKLIDAKVPGTKPVTHATVIVEGALVNTAKVTGDCWDPWCNKAEADAAAEKAAAAAAAAAKVAATTAAPYVAVAAIIGGVAAKAKSPPDPYAFATLLVGGKDAYAPQKLAASVDTHTPMWGSRFEHVPIAKGTTLRLQISDADPNLGGFNPDDPMGTVVITADDLAEAMKLGKNAAINVSDQSNKQVLFVNVLVLAED